MLPSLEGKLGDHHGLSSLWPLLRFFEHSVGRIWKSSGRFLGEFRWEPGSLEVNPSASLCILSQYTPCPVWLLCMDVQFGCFGLFISHDCVPLVRDPRYPSYPLCSTASFHCSHHLIWFDGVQREIPKSFLPVKQTCISGIDVLIEWNTFWWGSAAAMNLLVSDLLKSTSTGDVLCLAEWIRDSSFQDMDWMRHGERCCWPWRACLLMLCATVRSFASMLLALGCLMPRAPFHG